MASRSTELIAGRRQVAKVIPSHKDARFYLVKPGRSEAAYVLRAVPLRTEKQDVHKKWDATMRLRWPAPANIEKVTDRCASGTSDVLTFWRNLNNMKVVQG